FGAQGNLRWNFGVHNFMTYVATNAPTGTYDASRLANFGIGHWAVDGGGGYTYFDPQAGHEFGGARLHLQFQESVYRLPERRQHAYRLGRLAVYHETASSRPRRLLV